ncbi:hypothetical protein ACH3O9_14295 [Leeuwenhoekiella sp. A16]|uniref:hypothetical protein n=1 Tax=unclassified Leeuwenhoekiella TaxID=2615029 RepID=UPI003A809E17
MKQYLIASLLMLGTLNMQAQIKTDNKQTDNKQIVQVGDVMELNKPRSGNYNYVKFPKSNFIIKKGGIPNFKELYGEEVLVTEIKSTKNDATKIKIKRKDGKKFFNAFPSVTVILPDALDAGEIKFK